VWPDADPSDAIGRYLPLSDETSRAVVGVVEDLKQNYGATTAPALFVPLGTEPTVYGQAVVRIDPALPLQYAVVRQRIVERSGAARVTINSVEERLGATLEDPRFRGVLFTALALTALLLAGVGLYAVASLDVGQREYEMGVRLSLGATAADIRRLVVVDTCRPVVVGLLLGFAGAYWALKFLQQFLYQVQAGGAENYAAVTITLLTTAALAAWIPARRASRVDPAVVLRAQ
jgi:putative ABC transport system permease protein